MKNFPRFPNIQTDLKEIDNSQVSPNKSDLSLKGNHNTVQLTASAIDQAKNRPKTSFPMRVAIFFVVISNVIITAAVLNTTETTGYSGAFFAHNKQMQRMREELTQYTDERIANAVSKLDSKFGGEIRSALAQTLEKAQEGNRVMLSLQLIKEYDQFLIDGRREICSRDLRILNDLHDYYKAIGGNHGLSTREYQFSQMIAKKEIIVID